jgi:hypothetical protein
VGEDNLVEAPKLEVKPTSLEEAMKALFVRIPSGPISATKGVRDKSVDKPAWSHIGEYPNVVVRLPTNFESLGDNPLAQAAIAACEVLQPRYELATEEMATSEPDAKVQMYLAGVSWALHGNGGKLVKFHDVSGALGHGFYWVSHHALETKLGSAPWWAKGSPWHLTRGMTGKAWSSDLDSMTRRVNSLITKAAGRLDIRENATSYFRAKESFLGKEIRKSLPHVGTDLLTIEEKGYLSTRHAVHIEAYEALMDTLAHPAINDLAGLAKRVKEVGTGLRALSASVEAVVSHRITNLYPPEKRARIAARKRPIRELIDDLEFNKFVNLFDPAVLGGKRPFRLGEPLEGEEQKHFMLRSRNQYISSVSGLEAAGLKELQRLCVSWAEVTFGRENVQP